MSVVKACILRSSPERQGLFEGTGSEMGALREPCLSPGSREGGLQELGGGGGSPPHFLVGSSRAVTTSPRPQPWGEVRSGPGSLHSSRGLRGLPPASGCSGLQGDSAGACRGAWSPGVVSGGA